MRRIAEFDALRGIAAVVILLAHGGILPGTPWALSAVDLFFVLSGYLITANVLKSRHEPGFLARFFVRRSLRIWPAYYVALGACFWLNSRLKWDAPMDAWRNYLTFTQNTQAYLSWPLPRFSGMFQHTWTLAIEEQFYVLWPLLLRRVPKRAMGLIVASFVAMPLLLRGLGFAPILLLTRCDGLAIGSLLALWFTDHVYNEEKNSTAWTFGALSLCALVVPWVAAALLPAGWESGRMAEAFFTLRVCLFYFGLAGFVLCQQGKPGLAVLRDPRLCYLGTISYGLYLYHPLMFGSVTGVYKRYVMRRLGLTSTLLMELALIALSVLLAEMSRRWLEGPILRLRDRALPRPKDRQPHYRGPHARQVRRTSNVSASSIAGKWMGARGGGEP
jgi:peptidoglycan/LPS O-acetylase OafA/YrhL